jgi:hypothetical protein
MKKSFSFVQNVKKIWMVTFSIFCIALLVNNQVLAHQYAYEVGTITEEADCQSCFEEIVIAPQATVVAISSLDLVQAPILFINTVKSVNQEFPHHISPRDKTVDRHRDTLFQFIISTNAP